MTSVLLISNYYPPTHTAGTEQRTFGYATTLANWGHQVQVLCAGSWDRGDEHWNGFVDETDQGVQVRRVHMNWTLAPDPNTYLYRNPQVALCLKEWLAEWKPDIIHVTSCYTLSATVLEVAQSVGIPVVVTLTDFWFLCPRLSLLRSNGQLCDGQTTSLTCTQCLMADSRGYGFVNRVLPDALLAPMVMQMSKMPSLSRMRGLRGLALNMVDRKHYLKKMLNQVDQVLAPSTHLAQLFQASGLSQEIKVIHSGHDLAWLADTPPKSHSEHIRFGYLGQIMPSKGLHTAIQAFLQGVPPSSATLSIWGDFNKSASYTEELRDLINGREKDVRFEGPYQRAELGAVLSDIDVVVVPSEWHENNPRVCHEAFACRTPVIGSNVGGIVEFIKDGQNGLIFDRGNVESLADKVQQLVSNPAMVEALRNGIGPVKSISDEVRELLEVYEQVQ
ncbi:MAG: glycosyltransferase family 4 protein [Chloroflexota bacterium]